MSLIIPSRTTNKISTTLNADGSYQVAAGTVIDLIKLVPGNDMAGVKIGTTAGGEEILPQAPLTSGVTSLISVLLNGGTTIYFTGVTGSLAVTFFKK